MSPHDFGKHHIASPAAVRIASCFGSGAVSRFQPRISRELCRKRKRNVIYFKQEANDLSRLLSPKAVETEPRSVSELDFTSVQHRVADAPWLGFSTLDEQNTTRIPHIRL